jgi:glycosyltransferase involved in cell wall biosynthesis
MKLASSGWGGDIQRAKKTSFGRIFLFMAKKASRIITLSNKIEQELMEEKIDASRLCLIHNGVDLMKYRELEGKGQLRKKLGILDKKTIIYTGRLSPEKGVDFLIRGFSELVKNINCQMIIVADGPEKKSIVQLVDQYQLSKSVILLKGVDEVADYLNASNIFVLPSRFEGLSNSLLEAMACGLPVISTMVGGSIDIIEDGINGLLIDVDNEEQLIQAMTHILNDSTMAATMGRNARKVIEKDYALDKIADRYISLYKDL